MTAIVENPYALIPAYVAEAADFRFRVDSMVFVDHVDGMGYPTYLGYGHSYDQAERVAYERVATDGIDHADIKFSTVKES